MKLIKKVVKVPSAVNCDIPLDIVDELLTISDVSPALDDWLNGLSDTVNPPEPDSSDDMRLVTLTKQGDVIHIESDSWRKEEERVNLVELDPDYDVRFDGIPRNYNSRAICGAGGAWSPQPTHFMGVMSDVTCKNCLNKLKEGAQDA